jgi:hypothetical protein
MSKSNAARRRQRAGPSAGQRGTRKLAMTATAALVVLCSLSVFNTVRLSPAAGPSWPWVAIGAFLVGIAIVLVLVRYRGPEDRIGPGVVAGTCTAVLVMNIRSIFVDPRQHHVAAAASTYVYFLAAASLAGVCVACVVAILRFQLLPARTRPHRVTVYLRDDAEIKPNRLTRRFGPFEGTGFYQAFCTCGWSGSQHDMDSAEAEQKAFADAHRHAPNVADDVIN